MRGIRWVTAALLCAAIVVAMSGCAGGGGSSAPGATPGATPAVRLPDGLAFIQDGAAFVVRDGKPAEVLPGEKQQSAVAYDAEGDGLLVVENSGISTRAVRLVKAAEVQTLLQTQDGSNFGDVRFSSARGEGFFIINGQPGSSFHRFAVESGKEATGGALVKLPKSAAIGFDIAANGTTIVYATDIAEPAHLVVADELKQRFEVASLAYAFTPSFSRDGSTVCLTGIKSAGDPVSVWTLDLAARKLTEVPGTAQYKPSYPVFSPDGARIAFRNADDGSVWIVPATGGAAEKLPLTVDDAALDW